MLRAATLLIACLCLTAPAVFAQATSKPSKLPSAERIVDGYLKAIGGKKQVATIKDATYEWEVKLDQQPVITAKEQIKAPFSVRSDWNFATGTMTSSANARSTWVIGFNAGYQPDGKVHTLTGPEAGAAKLGAILQASHLLDYKKNNVLARIVSVTEVETTPVYVVEFSQRSGARLRYFFSTTTKLLLRVESGEGSVQLADYRVEGPILEPHRRTVTMAGFGNLTFSLSRVTYNSGVADSAFDPPRAATAIDVVGLLREVSRNQDQLEQRFTEYSFSQTETAREINSKGELKKETVKVYEVFPIANREPVMKLISENGVALAGERATKEQKRVEEEFAKADRDKDKNDQKAQKQRNERQRKRAARGNEGDDDDVEISQFLKIHEFISPRIERFRDRDAVVFDFRPRPGFKPSTREEDLISKLVGVVWIDPVDKQVMRLEARLAEGFKMAGGLLVNLRPGAAFAMEQTRMNEGIWLPRLAQINLSVKVLLFGGGDYNQTIEWSDYKHFSGDVGDYKLDAPKTDAPAEKKP